ncbi:uncharacterized protein LOC129045686 [Mirounga angustirostris]|uniref:uncharacterized protein LOC129045686 n=1 Tax=Mirounga angustirostris TaxID=9716 RepID=UPI00313C36EE
MLPLLHFSRRCPGWHVNPRGPAQKPHPSHPQHLVTFGSNCRLGSQTVLVGGACLQGESILRPPSPASPSCSHPVRLTLRGARHPCRLPPRGLATPLAVIGRRDAGSLVLGSGKCSPLLAPGNKVLGGVGWFPGCDGQRQVWTQSADCPFPPASPAPPPAGGQIRAAQRVTSFIATVFSGTACRVVSVGSICYRVRGQSLRCSGDGARAGAGTDRARGRSRTHGCGGRRFGSSRAFAGPRGLFDGRSFAEARGVVRLRAPPGVQGFGGVAAAGPGRSGDGDAGHGDFRRWAGRGGHARRDSGRGGRWHRAVEEESATQGWEKRSILHHRDASRL